jgi:8-oxo-dGTP pyrophosphatase MutT (NUDIX family)
VKTIIRNILREQVDKLIKCKKCDWSWKKSEGGPDMYFCHKCGTDNTPNNISENKQKKATGALIKCTKTNKVLLLLRNDGNPTWSLVSGGLEADENPLEALKREFEEELSLKPTNVKFNKVGVETNANNVIFHYYEGFTSEEFEPKLDNENLDWGWFSKNDLPSPLYKGMFEKIKNIYEKDNN